MHETSLYLLRSTLSTMSDRLKFLNGQVTLPLFFQMWHLFWISHHPPKKRQSWQWLCLSSPRFWQCYWKNTRARMSLDIVNECAGCICKDRLTSIAVTYNSRFCSQWRLLEHWRGLWSISPNFCHTCEWTWVCKHCWSTNLQWGSTRSCGHNVMNFWCFPHDNGRFVMCCMVPAICFT